MQKHNHIPLILQGASWPLIPQTNLSFMPEPQHAEEPPGPLSQFHAPQKLPHSDEQHFSDFLGLLMPPNWSH